MQALAREELAGAEHPPVSQLIARQRGTLAAGAAAAITEHLSLCGRCAALALEVADFLAAGDEGEEDDTSAGDDEEAWRALRRAQLLSPAEPPPARRRSPLASLAFAYGLAAAFAALSAALLLAPRPRPPRPPASPISPWVNPGLYDLAPASGERSGDAVPSVPIRFRSAGDAALLILNPAQAADAARYEVRIRRADGTLAWHSTELLRQPSGAFHLGLPAGALPAGRYVLELYGRTAGRPDVLLGTYRISIDP